MEEKTQKPKKKKLLVVLVVAAVVILCCGAPLAISMITYGVVGDSASLRYSEPAVVEEPIWLHRDDDVEDFESDMELLDLLGISFDESDYLDILDSYPEDFEEVVIADTQTDEEVKMNTYTNDYFPNFTFEYSSDWHVTEDYEDSEFEEGAQDLEITLEKDDYVLSISLIPIGPIGLHANCYEDLDYTRVQDEIVRAFDGDGYDYGYMYDDEYDQEAFESSRELYGEGDYVACGDLNILGGTETTFYNDVVEDYLTALLSVFLHEKGAKDENIIKEVDDIVVQL